MTTLLGWSRLETLYPHGRVWRRSTRGLCLVMYFAGMLAALVSHLEVLAPACGACSLALVVGRDALGPCYLLAALVGGRDAPCPGGFRL